ncbi:putative 8-amino-7-oxononanoate synthase [Cladorrhinum sp. PSN259]|nr:putative 8-amino-7-oxononanoate synthase [Cladorrhinum sp. PSN259]
MSQSKRLDATLARHLDRRKSRGLLRSLTLVPPEMADFSSNAYLSLSAQPSVRSAFLAQLQTAAEAPPSTTSPPLLGSGGSRLLDGNSARAEALEKTLAAFHNAPASLLFGSAMDANVGLFSCVPQPGDAIVYDELIHASIHDGMRLSRANKRIPFAHNSVWTAEKGQHLSSPDVDVGGPQPLKSVLLGLLAGPEGHLFRSGERNVFIAVEGVYSMDGDVVPLTEVVTCVDSCLPQGNGLVVVDEAHSVGVFGNRGRGLVCELGLEDRVWTRILGFGKAMGCSGGLVLCSEVTRSYLINYGRTLIYTTAVGLPSMISIEVAYHFIMSGGAEPLVRHLRDLVKQTHIMLLAVVERQKPPAHLLHVNSAEPKSSVIPVFTNHPRSLASHCQRGGFMVRPIVAPTVPKGTERIRICLHAANTVTESIGLITAIEAWLVARLEEARQSDAVKQSLVPSPKI